MDTVFWFAAPEVTQDSYLDRPIVLRMSTLSQPATVKVSMPANGLFTPITVNIPAAGTGTVDLTPWIDLIESRPPNTTLSSGLKITSTGLINIYYEVVSGSYGLTCQCNPEIFALKGRSGLGKDFLIPSQNILSNWPYNPPSTHSFEIVATEDNTVIVITPSKNIVGHTSGIPFTINLNRGQVYSATAANQSNNNHLGGSTVIADKDIAISVKDDGLFNTACWDMGGDQLIPIGNLSTEYIAIQGYLTSGITTDKVFITAVADNTTISVGGVVYSTINAGQTSTIPFTSPSLYISANKKIYAFQISGSGCEVGLSSLPSISACRGSSELSFTRSSTAQLTFMVITRVANQSFFQLNGTPVSSSLFNYVSGSNNQWVYARITIPVTDVPVSGSARISNTNGLFHLGVIHGDGQSGGARFGYFSDFSIPVLDVFQDSITVCDNMKTLDAGAGYASYVWNTGANSQSIQVTQTGLYKVIVTNADDCMLSDSTYVRIQPAVTDSSTISICDGTTYILPWGMAINSPGIYRDTLRFLNSSCDSVRRIVKVEVQVPQIAIIDTVICSGQSYILPLGGVLNMTGTYHDTIRYNISGCDSLRLQVNLTVKPAPVFQSLSVVICEGQNYFLPSGIMVNTSGAYNDTIRYFQTRCDSLRSTINLAIQKSQTSVSDIVICQGQSYTLPWGEVVIASGTYKDTLRYFNTGCDSLYRIIHLKVTPAIEVNLHPSICVGDSFTLPWGAIVSAAGLYKDTVRTNSGCDSLIRVIDLSVNSKPIVTINKSNDINCLVGVAMLTAFGGTGYNWTPGNSLSNPGIYNPIASPDTTTTYKVVVTSSSGCEDSANIQVLVKKDISVGTYSMVNAFTPNGDGLNDCFGVRHWGQVKDLKFTIYNRWGQLIFSSNDLSKCWDGTFNGQIQSTGVFVYHVIGETNCGLVNLKGTVLLIR